MVDPTEAVTAVKATGGLHYSVAQADGTAMEWEVLGPAPPEPFAPGTDGIIQSGGERPQGHHYSVGMMGIALHWICWANLSLRAAAKCFVVLVGTAAPSFWTLRQWVLRLGLYELQRPKPQANDWVFIVDGTIAVGEQKALVVLGVRLAQMEQRGFNLGHQDVVPLELRIVTRCNGPLVQEALAAAARAVGVPRLLVSDGGSEVKKGVSLFQGDHPEVSWNYDLTHRFALLLEKELGPQAWWAEYVTRTSHCRQACQQTPWSYLQPPAPRLKSRWLNIKPLITWGLRVLTYQRRVGVPKEVFDRLFGWLAAYEAQLWEVLQMITVVETTSRVIKHAGLNADQVRLCAQKIRRFRLTERVRAFGRQVLAFLREQLQAVKTGETLLSSSDVLESLFGKYKAVVERSPLRAITVMILLIAALTSERTAAVVREAMETVSEADVQAWFTAHGEPTLLAKRRAALPPLKGKKPA